MNFFLPQGYDLAHFAGVVFMGTLLVFLSRAAIGFLSSMIANAAAQAKKG